MSKWLKQLYSYCTNKTASASVVSRQDNNDKTIVKHTKPLVENYDRSYQSVYV